MEVKSDKIHEVKNKLNLLKRMCVIRSLSKLQEDLERNELVEEIQDLLNEAMDNGL